MKQADSISWEDLRTLFSVLMCLDSSMHIICVSDTLGKCMPECNNNPALADIFDTLRPASLATFEDGLGSVTSLCLLAAKSGKFAIRGQLLHTTYQGQEVLCFCGAPWLFWINTNSPDTKLGLGDFSPQDVQLDQLFFMSTERQMVEDLGKLNQDLQSAKHDLEEAQQAQRQFFAQMSHEIRTPLNGVVSALALLDHYSGGGEEQARFVQLAQRSSENLMQVINYVLSVSKIELSPHQEELPFSWVELIQSTSDIVSAKAEEKSLKITLDLSPDLPAMCYGNPERFRQTLLNLLINAIKFTDKGTITISALPVEPAEQLEGHCTLRLEVADTGVGIAEQELEKIFDPFWSSVPAGISSQEAGTGLGLDIVRRNVASMGGSIQVSSIPGEGARFWFDLPVKVAQISEQIAAAGKPDEESEAVQLAGKVLLVDDNETNLILGSLILESLGLDVTPVDGGGAAVAAAREGSFDLVLMDISMPDIDGLEATRQIRRFMRNDQLPIVALTAHIDYAEKRACLDIGMDDYLTKPIVRDDLQRTLAIWLATDKTADSTAATPAVLAETEAAGLDLVDTSVLQELISQIGRDNLQLVVDKVKTESAVRWNELQIAQSEVDNNAIRRHVHSLASIFRSVGLMPVGDALGAVEDCLRAGETPAAGWLNELVQLRVDSLVALDEQVVRL